MFDIGFWELSVIMVVALLVIGPERLPGVARKMGMYLGKARRFVSSVKDEVNKELASEELKRALKEQQESVGLHEIIEETKDAMQEAKQEYLVKNKDLIEQETKAIEESVSNKDKNDGPSK